MRQISWLVVMSLIALLQACGGGGGSCGLLGSLACGLSEANTVNVSPVARAGAMQSVLLNQPVQLDGSASTDANNDVLTYKWAWLTKPAGSLAAFDDATSVKPVFTADRKGVYIVTLEVNDGKLTSQSAMNTITVSETNAPPVANAGLNQSVVMGATVTLDGRDSSDANREDVLTYKWFLSRPDATRIVLTGVRPTFAANLAGDYVATLIVNDGLLDSEPVSVRVAVAAPTVNAPPVAAAGPAQNVITASLVTLDGSTSTDANRDALTYKWAFVKLPDGSSASLTGALTAKPTFTADAAGIYVVSLVVNDGKVNSDVSVVVVTALVPNVAPIANAGTEQAVTVGALVNLSGSASTDANGDPLTYKWALTSMPTGSRAVLTGEATMAASFTPDVVGIFVATLTVNDSRGGSSIATVPIYAGSTGASGSGQ